MAPKSENKISQDIEQGSLSDVADKLAEIVRRLDNSNSELESMLANYRSVVLGQGEAGHDPESEKRDTSLVSLLGYADTLLNKQHSVINDLRGLLH